MTVHGGASVAPYEINVRGDTLVQTTSLSPARVKFTGKIRLLAGSRAAMCSETVENRSAWDRPIARTQYGTLGRPLLDKGRTRFRATATRGKGLEQVFTGGKGSLRVGREFDWPLAPK